LVTFQKLKVNYLLICTNNNTTELILTTTVCYVSHVPHSLNVNLQKTRMIIVCLQYNLLNNLGDLLTDRFPLKCQENFGTFSDCSEL